MTVVKQNVVSGPVNSTGVITAFFNLRERRTNRRRTAVTLPHSWQRLAATLAVVVAAGLSGRGDIRALLVTAPVDTFASTKGVAAWNNQATNAGNSSALYLNAMLGPQRSEGPWRRTGARADGPAVEEQLLHSQPA